MGKVVYKLLSVVFGLVGGVLAGALFKQVWKLLAGESEAPHASDEERTWKEVLPAAALQGAIAGAVKAVVSRGGASGFRRLTGTWPA